MKNPFLMVFESFNYSLKKKKKNENAHESFKKIESKDISMF
jgi:hypothetical protein